MGILKVAATALANAVSAVTQTNDPMGILKDRQDHQPPPVSVVTQTNDPMGILKVTGMLLAFATSDRYTDQRSDGDTERGGVLNADGGLTVLHRPTIRWGY